MNVIIIILLFWITIVVVCFFPRDDDDDDDDPKNRFRVLSSLPPFYGVLGEIPRRALRERDEDEEERGVLKPLCANKRAKCARNVPNNKFARLNF
jgi:hypothetical protein